MIWPGIDSMYNLSNGSTTQYNMYNLYISANTIYTVSLLADSCTTLYVQSKLVNNIYSFTSNLCLYKLRQYLQPYLHTYSCISPSSTFHSCVKRTHTACVSANIICTKLSLLQCLLVTRHNMFPMTSKYVY